MTTRSLHSAGVLFGAITCIVLLLNGCAGNVYTPSTLPPMYRAEVAVPDGNATLTRLAGPSRNGAQIGPGDVLEVSIGSGYDGDVARPQALRVGEDGLVHVPPVGAVAVAGLEPPEAERAIGELAIRRDVYLQPLVTVAIKQAKTTKVTVVGAVKSPGIYELDRASSDLLSALARAGGRSENAGNGIEVVHRSQGAERAGPALAVNTLASHTAEPTPAEFPPGIQEGPTTTRIDLTEINEGVPSIGLNDGDVVFVQSGDARIVHVIGLVKRPTEIRIRPGEDLRLLEALAQAGGTSMSVADSVQVIRPVANQTNPLVIKVSIRRAKRDGDINMLLADGDVVSVEETPLTVMTSAFDRIVRFTIGGRVSAF